MSAYTPIQWCDSTVNPTSGCDGCELYNPRDPDEAICYARRIHEERLARYEADGKNYAPTFDEVRMIKERVHQATYWSDLRGKCRVGKPWLDLQPRTIFVGDLSDVMSRAVSDDFIEGELFRSMDCERGRRHVWMMLTKRPSRLADISERRPGGLPRSVIAMTSVTSQPTAAARIPQLLRVQARWRGLSIEPLFERVSVAEWLPALDWVIIGGASGANARPFHVDWAHALIGECEAAGVPCFVKQLGARPAHGDPAEPLRLRDTRHGSDVAEWPAGLAVRQMPDFAVRESADLEASRHA